MSLLSYKFPFSSPSSAHLQQHHPKGRDEAGNEKGCYSSVLAHKAGRQHNLLQKSNWFSWGSVYKKPTEMTQEVQTHGEQEGLGELEALGLQ